jgi:hypothetical protein
MLAAKNSRKRIEARSPATLYRYIPAARTANLPDV